MLSKEMINQLNDQIQREMKSSNMYLALSVWAHEHSYSGAAKFLADHADEESTHARKLIGYLNDTSSKVEIRAVPAPVFDVKNLLDVFVYAQEAERQTTKNITDIVDFALSSKDYATFNFLQWYVAEQVEEEMLFADIVDKLRLLADSNTGFFLADKYIRDLKVDRG